jgi:regulation of enolase protein 1 (concanavalin A-like superfamily)
MQFHLVLVGLSVAASAPPPDIVAFDDPRLAWHSGTPQHQFEDGGKALTIVPTPHLDYWSRTFYSPLLIKADAQTLLTPVAADTEATFETAFTLTPCAQFDQAGIMVLIDERTWVKAGIEFTDGAPRLSCVVTNDGFSDWSTQKWPDWDGGANATSIRVRLSKLMPGHEQGPSIMFEAAPWVDGATAESAASWVQVRIASLRSGDRPWRMGLFAISPIEAAGSMSRFHYMRLGPKQALVHDADPGHAKVEL